jgi:membrane-associated phospholipid phosphatase
MPRRAALFIVAAAAGVVLLFVTWYAAFHVGVFERADQSIFRGFTGLPHGARAASIADFIARLCDPNPYLYFAAMPVMVALARGRTRVALAIMAILLCANTTTQLLKPLLAEPRASITEAAWPSGHATAAMSLALSWVIAVPSRWRPYVAAAGAAFAVGVSYSFLTLGWHYPSDVFGGFLVAATWTSLVVAAVRALDARRARALPATGASARGVSLREALTPSVAAAMGALGLAAIIALARPHAVISYARAHEAFVVGAAAIGVTGLFLAAGVMLALRR